MKYKLSEKIMTEFAALRPKTYNYLKDDLVQKKKVKSTKKCVIRRQLKFVDYKHCLEATHLKNKIKYLEK